MLTNSQIAVAFMLTFVASGQVTWNNNEQYYEVSRSGSVIQKVYITENLVPLIHRTDLANMDLLRDVVPMYQQQQTSCILGERQGSSPASTKVPGTTNISSIQSISFAEIAKSVGIHHVHRKSMASRPRCVMDFIIPHLNSSRLVKLKGEFCVPEHLTGGAAVGDYNNDGLDDIYFTVFHSRSMLYRNNGDNTFTDVTKETGIGPDRYGNGASWADVDQDGDLDLYVTTVGDNRHYLFINNGGGFKEEALNRNCSLQFSNKRKLAGMSANFGDFDGDGYPDLYVTEWIPHTLGKPSASRLLRNKGDISPGYFEDVTDLYGVDMDRFQLERYNLSSGTYSFASSFTDFDNDGLVDLLITADFGESRMFWNMGKNKSFSECTYDCGLEGDQDAMGHAIGDWDNDGLMDWFSTAIMDNSTDCETVGCTFDDEGNRLYKNLGGRKFIDVTSQAGVQDGGWGWGAAFLDFNNDGYQDIVMTNGLDLPTTTTDDHIGKQRMRLWKNLGEGLHGKMKEVSSELGMNSTNQGRGLLKWDIDDDGDVDVVVCNNVGAPEIYENIGGNEQNWIKVNVMHSCKQRPEFLCPSLGARVQIKTENNGHTQTQEVGSSTHFLAQSGTTTHFGLGSRVTNVTVHVTWPATGARLYLYNVPPNIKLRVVEPWSGAERIAFSALEMCPTLKIVEITKQPTRAVVTINANGKTVHFKKHPQYTFEEMESQNFSYKIQLFPNMTTTVTSESRAYVLYLNDMETEGKCRDGKPTAYQNITSTDERRYDGISNNKQHVLWGAGGQNLRRTTLPAYSDGIASPASACYNEQRRNQSCAYSQEYSGYGSTRPSPRDISNLLFRQTGAIISARRINDFHVHFGQFITHDTDLTTTLPRFEFQEKLNDVWLPITVPKSDVYFDLGDSDNSYLPFVRSIYNRCTGRRVGTPREQINTISSYIDGGVIYGSSKERNIRLRTFTGGKMKVSEHELLPLDVISLPNANDVGRETKRLFYAGDSRANVQSGLTAVHIVFLREHNRLCDEYLKTKPSAKDEDIFQYARKIVASELQAITFREYLPSIFGGSEEIPPYRGYNDSLDASADHVAVTAALRFGHSQINNVIWRLNEQGKPIQEGHLPLRDAYFAPERIIQEGGIDPILRGAFAQPAQEVDVKMVDDVRNFLFALNRRGQDLSSINIQRGRDHGLPDLNTVRETIGLTKYSSFDQITRNKEVTKNLRTLYGNINNVDLWVGGLAEDHKKGEVGPTFRKIILDSFLRIRDGDRFWYENILTPKEVDFVENLTLAEIIRLNTNITNVPRHVFYSTLYCADVQNEHCVHKNTTGNTKIVNCTMDEMSNQEIHRLKQKLQASQYKIKKLNENMTYVKLQNQALSSQLDELQQNYTNKNREKTHLAAKLEKNGLFGADAVALEIFLLVLIGLLLLLSVTFMILFYRTRRRGEKQQQKAHELTASRDTIKTTVTMF